ncbi:unnamed protein product [Rhodiola kirilowii]
MELIHEVPPIKVDDRIVACEGGDDLASPLSCQFAGRTSSMQVLWVALCAGPSPLGDFMAL